MVQWSRGFSGNTHATRVEEAEAAVRNSVTVLEAQSATAQSNPVKNVRKLAERLLSARVRMLKARHSQRAGERHSYAGVLSRAADGDPNCRERQRKK